MYQNKPTMLMFPLLVFSLMRGAYCDWGYGSPDQRGWSRRNENCRGRNQSPISITARRAIPLIMPAIEMVGYHNPLPRPLKITNNGHSVSLSIPKTSPDLGDGFRIPYVFGGRLDNEYEFEGLHFHWGDRNNRGSEHVINDMRYSMEMHMIHRNRKYKDVPEAQAHSDGLTVLAFFYELTEGTDCRELAPIMRLLPSLIDENTTLVMNQTFSLASIIPADTDRFYTYKGSLTTPPCSEAVTWILFPETLPVSIFQMEKFRQLSASSISFLADNFRNLQPLNRRRVFVRVTNKKYPRVQQYNNVHYSKWDWLTPMLSYHKEIQENEIFPTPEDDENDLDNST